jgi:hypothetical protein
MALDLDDPEGLFLGIKDLFTPPSTLAFHQA